MRKLVTFCGAVISVAAFMLLLPACDSTGDPRDPGSDTGSDVVDADDGCPDVPCGAGQVCEAGRCVDEGACIDNDNDGYGRNCSAGDDCDDRDANVNPARSEVCGDDIDNDCNFIIDDLAACTPCTPECTPGTSTCSGDRVRLCDDSSGCAQYSAALTCGRGEACRDGACVELCADRDLDGFAALADCPPVDCDDERADVFPGAPEICDGVDNDCDRITDEGFVCDEPCDDECSQGQVTCTADGAGFIACRLADDGCYFETGRIPCPDGRACVDGTCVEEVVCIDSDGDGAGPFCDTADCRPADALSHPAATDICDGLDNNCNGIVDDGGVCAGCPAGTVATATALAAGEEHYTVACGGNQYFSLPSISGEATIIVASNAGPLPVALGTNGGGSFAATQTAFTLGDSSALTINDSCTGCLVRVNAVAGTRLRLAVSLDSSPCDAETQQPNNSPSAAAQLGSLPHVVAGQTCAGDFDFFEIDAAPGALIAVDGAFDGRTGGELRAEIWRNGAQTTPTRAGDPGGSGLPDGRFAFFRADLPGSYLAVVRGVQQTSANEYALAITEVTVPGCNDDSLETVNGLDNDSFATATTIAAGVTLSGTLCHGDLDVYELGTLSQGSHVSATLTRTAGGGNLDITLYRDSFTHLSQDRMTDGEVELVDNNISTTGRYYLVVRGRGATDSADYTLTWSTP